MQTVQPLAPPKPTNVGKKRFILAFSVGIVLILIFYVYTRPKVKRAVLSFGAARSHNKNNFEKAIGQYKRILATNPNNTQVQYNLGVAYLNTDQIDKAKRQIEILEKMGADEHAMILDGLVSEKEN